MTGWNGAVQGRRGYNTDYDVTDNDQGQAVIALRMPGVYVQQVCYSVFYTHVYNALTGCDRLRINIQFCSLCICPKSDPLHLEAYMYQIIK